MTAPPVAAGVIAPAAGVSADLVSTEPASYVSLLPGEKEESFEYIIAASEKGIAIVGEGSFSIDQQR